MQEIFASNNLEQKQSKYKCKQRLLECEGRVLSDNITKSGGEINKSYSQIDIPTKKNPP